jgi:hypothetical protein
MNHGRKMVAPIIITVLLVLYYVGIIALFVFEPGIFLWAKLVMVIVPLALSGVLIGACISRIKEIQGGEEDDLSKY